MLIAGAMWGISPAGSPSEVFNVLHMAAAAAIALLGGCISFSGILAFRRARTTVSPLQPERTSALVATGIYRFTRNPMYVGLLIILFAWSVFLLSALSVVGPLMFVLYMGRFQIAPEERVLSTLFGPDYADYSARVRRWL
jgi:protein-S-isoprenylcysteine O-methyltransferase Ste14